MRIVRTLLIFLIMATLCSSKAEKEQSILERAKKTFNSSQTRGQLALKVLLKSRNSLSPKDKAILLQQIHNKTRKPFLKFKKNFVHFRKKNGLTISVRYLGKKSFIINNKKLMIKDHESIWRFLKRNQKQLLAQNPFSVQWFTAIITSILPVCHANPSENSRPSSFDNSCPPNPLGQDLRDMHAVVSTLFLSEGCDGICADGFDINCDSNEVTLTEGRMTMTFNLPSTCPGTATINRRNDFVLGLGNAQTSIRVDLDSECRERSLGRRIDWVTDPETARQLVRDIQIMTHGFQQRECPTLGQQLESSELHEQ